MMDPGFNLKYENPIQKAGLLSKVLFLWVRDLLQKGKQQELQMTDLFKVLESDNSKNLGDLLEKNWNKELAGSKKKPSLLKVVLKTFWLRFFLWGIVMFVQLLITIIQPTVLAYFITLFDKKTQENVLMEMFLYGTLLILMSLLTAVMLHQGHFYFRLIGMRCRVAISSLVYRKATRLNQSSLSQISTGDIINLLSNDVSRFDIGMTNLNILWMVPFFAILIPYFLWKEVGWTFLAGFWPLIILSIPTQSFLANITRKLRLKIAKKTDHRVRLMTEVLSGIQVIKMFSWEKPFEKIINEARDSELKDIKTCSYYRGIFQSCSLNLETVALFFTLMTYVLTKHTVTADKVFAVIQYLNILQVVVCVHIFKSFIYGAEHLSALQRLGDFLNLDERESHSLVYGKDAGIYLNNVCAAWTTSRPTLRDIHLRISPGTFCAIVGQVGAGKSSLLQVILGELPVSSGEVSLESEISFASQEPWLFGSSVRNNILFGQPYNKSWYDEIVHICSLEKDLQDLPHGDHTIVGDKGVKLSGGQKARINLARCVYRKASIYIMDDPLSAVDTQVGKFLFEECICKHLRGKTRILVAHQLQLLKDADLIVVMREGRIEAQGTYQELIDSNLPLSKFVALPKENEKECNEIIMDEIMITQPRFSYSRKNSFKEILLNTEEEKRTIIRETEKSSSDPGVFALKEYFRATNNVCLVITLIAFFIGGEALTTIAHYWVAFWTDQEELRKWNNTDMGKETSNNTIMDNYFFDKLPTGNGIVTLLKTDVALILYGIIIVLAIVVTFFKAMLFFKVAVMSSKNLHAAMFHSVLLAPMKFFTSNPCGSILNRFSKDLGAVDELLPGMLLDAIQFTFPVLGSFVNITVTNPYTIGLIIVCMVLLWYLTKLSLPAIKSIKHLEGVAKSPAFSHVSSTMNGLSTIRSTNSGSMLIDEFDQHQNTHTSACYLIHATIVTFTTWVDYICVFFLACITYSYIILNMFSPVNSSLVGLGITQVLSLFGYLQFGFYQCSEVVNQLTNVERVLQYSNIETDGPFETHEENIPKETWPSKGGIEFKRLSLSYDEDHPPVLKDLNFTIIPEEKVGIVGRTGAGKSSLVSALFRLAHIEGSVMIDGVDTKVLGLTYLRKRISIIPQDPVLFSGTLRYNLDPFDEFDDEQIWRVLADVELSDSVTSLDFMVRQGGSNFSVGQRQLICLARAMLRKNKILILDEATANVDLRTDFIIQSSIRRNFRSCTVLTIAHRLNTIMDSDRVLVMSSGRIVEFDHPYKLLQDEYGYFRRMVDKTGPALREQLTNISREAFGNVTSL